MNNFTACFWIAIIGMFIAKPAIADENKNQPLWSQADKYWGKEAMEKARQHELKTMGKTKTAFIMADRLEWQSGDENAFIWDGQAWYGTDENKLWLKTEGEYNNDEAAFEDGELQALWSKPIATYWDFQAGIRYDFKPKGRTYLVAGIQGLAPYWFEIDASAFLANNGDITGKIEAEYDMFLSQKLILQPRGELGFALQDNIEDLQGAGLSGLDLGLRLRYELKREIAPYIGIEWQSNLGETAILNRTLGEQSSDTKLIIGLRSWY